MRSRSALPSRKGREERADLFRRMTWDILQSEPMEDAKEYRHHGDANSVYTHCVRTAWCVLSLCILFRVSSTHTRSAVRAAAVHDLFGYDWEANPAAHRWLLHKRRLSHAIWHGKEASRAMSGVFNLSDRQREAITKHMFPTYPVPPLHCEGWLLTAADKMTALKELGLNMFSRFGFEAKEPLALRLI